MFNEEEIEALVLGARVVQSWGDPAWRAAAGDVLAKVEAVLPVALRDRLSETSLFAPPVHVPRAVASGLGELRTALRERRKIRFRYVDKGGASSERTIWPLGLFFWGTTWSVAGYCELREGFRNFRADRVAELRVLPERFPEIDRKSTRLNSSHLVISYAVFCLKKKQSHHISYLRISPWLTTEIQSTV